ncbi:MAG TPA: enoyl-CoA hydratase/isomerase family protein [Bryobacteraceae bacterium]|nr:enoyl-CoA hydratase/isomerase family protein [Bryobacteraceae bacterium]
MEPVQYHASAGVARITLQRPEKRNALNPESIAALRRALAHAAKQEDVKIVLLAGAGRDFCAGLDLKALDEASGSGVMGHLESARQFGDLILDLRRHPHPVIAAVQGRALAGGAGIATASDMILASESASFGYPEVKIGFVPAIVAALLRRSVGEKRAFELLAAGNSISARDAHSLGLVNHVFPDGEFEQSVDSYVVSFAGRSASALSLLKDVLYQTDGVTLEKAVEAAVHTNALARMTEDAQRGFEKFAKKN